MVAVTLSRGSTSIDIPLLEENGTPLLSGDYGKPNLNVQDGGGTLYPRTVDQWSQGLNYTLAGRISDYGVTHDLADLISSVENGDALELEIPLDEYDSPVEVVPSAGSDQALTLTYPPEQRGFVEVALNLSRVGNSVASVTQEASTPRATGSGPVQVNVGTSTIDLPRTALSVERSVGRPKDTVRRAGGTQTYPNYIAKQKPVSDVFTLSFQALDGIPSTFTSIVQEIFQTNITGRSGIGLDFNGILGLGEVTVMPTGSAPFRQQRQAGDRSVVVPTFEFQRVFG